MCAKSQASSFKDLDCSRGTTSKELLSVVAQQADDQDASQSDTSYLSDSLQMTFLTSCRWSHEQHGPRPSEGTQLDVQYPERGLFALEEGIIVANSLVGISESRSHILGCRPDFDL